MVKLDVSGICFDYIDFTEAHLFLSNLPSYNQKLEIRVWGVTVLSDISNYCGKKYSDDIYISGYCKIIFENVSYATIKMLLYKSVMDKTSYVDEYGDNVLITGTWGNIKDKVYCNEYILGGSVDWPAAYDSQFNIYSKSKVYLLYNEKNVITVKQYCTNPDKYGYNY